MSRLIAVCAAALLLVGCSQKAPFEALSKGNCTSAQANFVNKHISGQIDSLAKKDWELAYSFASDKFQANVSLEDFKLIIGTQYAMLIKNKGYEFNECNVAGSTITQEVDVTSDEQVFSLTYTLTVNDSVLGVESAVVSKSVSQINT